MRKLFTPFEYLKPAKQNKIFVIWLFSIIVFWAINSFVGETHLFPPINKVFASYGDLFTYYEMGPHIVKTLVLSLQSMLIAVLVSCLIVFLSPLQILKPLAVIISQLRFLPFAGLTFYLSIIFKDGRSLQTSILVIFTTTFLVTSLLSFLKDVPEEEFDNAKTMGMTRWETLWEVVILGRLDYIIEAVRQNLAIVTMSIVTVEAILQSAGGIGAMISQQSKLGNHSHMLAIQILILLATYFLDRFINWFRKTAFPYSNF